MMDPVEVIKEFYDPASKAFQLLVKHGQQVAQKALAAAEAVQHLYPDLEFIEEAAMLHDIGIFLTNTPDLGCTGTHPYLCHGYLGRDLLVEKGLVRHGLVCERHVGVGIFASEVRQFRLPLPQRDMVPQTIEEKLICYADKFFSKSANGNGAEKKVPDIVKGLVPYGQEKGELFLAWDKAFGLANESAVAEDRPY